MQRFALGVFLFVLVNPFAQAGPLLPLCSEAPFSCKIYREEGFFTCPDSEMGGLRHKYNSAFKYPCADIGCKCDHGSSPPVPSCSLPNVYGCSQTGTTKITCKIPSAGANALIKNTHCKKISKFLLDCDCS